KKRGYGLPVEALDAVASIRAQELQKQLQRLTSLELKFPENVYNSALQGKLALLDQLTSRSRDVMAIGSGEGIAQAYRILFDAYSHVGNAVADFTPVGKSPEYIQSFRSSMAQVAGPLKAKASELRNEALEKANTEGRSEERRVGKEGR